MDRDLVSFSRSRAESGLQEEEEREKLPPGGTEDKKWSEQIVTLDCLRKRLLAERTSSKAAKEEAGRTGEKVVELENQLKMETRARDGVEKKLKLAMKKLKSMKLTCLLEQFNPDLVDNVDSCHLPNSCVAEPEMSNREREIGDVSNPINTSTAELEISNREKEKEEATKSSSFHASSSSNSETDDSMADQATANEGSASMVESSHSDITEDNSKEEICEFKDSASSPGSRSEIPRLCSRDNESEEGEKDGAEYVDNSLALIPAEEQKEAAESSGAVVGAKLFPEREDCGTQAQRNKDICEVLIALQRAKEHLRSSMEEGAVCRPRSLGLCGV